MIYSIYKYSVIGKWYFCLLWPRCLLAKYINKPQSDTNVLLGATCTQKDCLVLGWYGTVRLNNSIHLVHFWMYVVLRCKTPQNILRSRILSDITPCVEQKLKEIVNQAEQQTPGSLFNCCLFLQLPSITCFHYIRLRLLLISPRPQSGWVTGWQLVGNSLHLTFPLRGFHSLAQEVIACIWLTKELAGAKKNPTNELQLEVQVKTGIYAVAKWTIKNLAKYVGIKSRIAF